MGKRKYRQQNHRRDLVIRQHGIDCAICGEPCLYANKYKEDPRYLTIDHIVPASKGGSDHLENLRPAHAICNQLRGNNGPANMEQAHINAR